MNYAFAVFYTILGAEGKLSSTLFKSDDWSTCVNSNTFNPLHAELNPICRLLTLLGGATIVVFSRLSVNYNSLGPTRGKLEQQ
jgi:hypothetical protein